MVSDAEKAFAFFAQMMNEIHDIREMVSTDVLDVDEFSIPNSNGTVFATQRNYYKPIVVEYILAVFPVASTSVVINLGLRQIPVQNIAAGVFTCDTRMQLEMDDVRNLTIAPAGAGYFEIMGRTVERERDRK
jgi:hypothetical protein